MDPRMLMSMMAGQRRQAAPGEDWNVDFYMNERPSEPDGALIDDIHEKWADDFDRLEYHHGYIQWLFPVFENAGMNFDSMALTKQGAAKIRADPQASWRVVKSYKLILRFFGLALADEVTGRIERLPALHASRMSNLNNSAHNWLRVSRIITSLGELGFHRYKRPLVEALETEVAAGSLANAARSLREFWRPLVDQEGSAAYARKTLEEEADREEGCLFARGGRFAREEASVETVPA